MTRLLEALYRRLGPSYPRVVIAVVVPQSAVVAFAGVWLLTLYQRMTTGQFWTLVLAAEVLVVLEMVVLLPYASRLVRPADPWLRGNRSPASALAAWRALVGLPLGLLSHHRAVAIAMNVVPISVFVTAYLNLRWYAVLVLLAGAAVVVAYSVFLRFFALELALRPPLAAASLDLREEPTLADAPSVPLRVRLLLALPATNVITGVVVAALSTSGPTGLRDLGLDVLAAVGVASTLSLGLTLLLARSVLAPLGDLRRATERARTGDLRARVPVVSADETGVLAASFNRMLSGMQEREALREAFGTYVDPELAERVLAEGAVLEGEEVDVTVLFLDMRDYTAFAEDASPREVVVLLNELFGLVVPVLHHHGGHVDKYVGDGLLAVFGAPDALPDHAEWGVAAAREIAHVVRERWGQDVGIGIGVNSGSVIAGTIGGGGHLEFTVIGDVVNTAARVERVTRQTGDVVLLTEATRRLLIDDPPGLVPRGTVDLPGKSARVHVHALRDHDDTGVHQPLPRPAQAREGL